MQEKFKKSEANICDAEVILSEKAIVHRKLAPGKVIEPSIEKSVALLARGPIHNLRSTVVGYAPYTSRSGFVTDPQNFSGNTENYNILYNTRKYDFENPTFSSTISDLLQFTSSPDTVQSDLDCGSSSTLYQISPCLKQTISSLGDVVDNTQLPEDLSDFILKYSQEYTTRVRSPESGTSARSRNSSISDSNNQTNFDSPLYRILVEDNCVSPLSAKSAPQCSPVLPRTAAQIPAIFEENQLETTAASKNLSAPEFLTTNRSRKELKTSRLAKCRLRALINDNEIVEAWAWSCKCIQVNFNFYLLTKSSSMPEHNFYKILLLLKYDRKRKT